MLIKMQKECASFKCAFIVCCNLTMNAKDHIYILYLPSFMVRHFKQIKMFKNLHMAIKTVHSNIQLLASLEKAFFWNEFVKNLAFLVFFFSSNQFETSPFSHAAFDANNFFIFYNLTGLFISLWEFRFYSLLDFFEIYVFI